MNEVEWTIEVRESNNFYWVNRHLKVGWEILGLFPADQNRVMYVICWTDKEMTPVEPVFPFPDRTTKTDMSSLQHISDEILLNELRNDPTYDS